MSKNVDVNYGSGVGVGFLLFLAIGILNAWVCNCVPWYVGLAIGVVLYVFSFIGLIPVLGPIIYWFAGHWFLNVVHASNLTWPFWLGLIVSILYTIFAIFVILIVWLTD